MTLTTHEQRRTIRPLLGLRRQPGRLALALMRTPRPLYHRRWGRLLGHTFLLITHQGRKSGKRRETVAMALRYDPETCEAVVFSAWGPNTQWIQNLRAHPALEIQIGGERYVPEQHFLSEDEAVAVGMGFRRRHPLRLRLFATILGWGDLGSEAAMHEFVRRRPFVAFRPAREQLPNEAGHLGRFSYVLKHGGRPTRPVSGVASSPGSRVSLGAASGHCRRRQQAHQG
jgi:deazaflavin-dependent oxidoreductase (nitroreductase family)